MKNWFYIIFGAFLFALALWNIILGSGIANMLFILVAGPVILVTGLRGLKKMKP